MEYLKVLGFQFKVILDCDSKNEFLVSNKDFENQIEVMKDIITIKNPDVIVLPEMCYQESLDLYFKELSKDKLIIAGSIYEDGVNMTKVFFQSELYSIPKCNASGAEPMVRFIDECSTEDFVKYKLKSHLFDVNGRCLAVLNCMEYYKNAYYIARSVPNLFGIICICSNNNVSVFLDETRAIHNHNENVYTFMVNCVSTYMGKSYANGESYVYGPIQFHEREWLDKEGIKHDDYVSSILRLGSEEEYFYGEFSSDFSRFGRSDEYFNNPRCVEVGMIRKKVLK